MINKPIIGIITRKSISNEGHNINIVYNDLVNAINNNGGIPIGITKSEIFLIRILIVLQRQRHILPMNIIRFIMTKLTLIKAKVTWITNSTFA